MATQALMKRVAVFRQPAADSSLWFEDPPSWSVEGRAAAEDRDVPLRWRDECGDAFVLVEHIGKTRFLPKDAVKPKRPGEKPFRGPIPVDDTQIHLLSLRWRTPSILSVRVYLHQGRFRYALSSDATATADKKPPATDDRERVVAAMARFLQVTPEEASDLLRGWSLGS